MLIIALYKAVPSRTTKVVTVGGVLRREEMDLVMNPFDSKAVEASDYLKRAFGGKVVSLTMGPDFKLKTIAANLFAAPVEGIDESYILSDRRMAGADTWATSYTLSLGIKKIVQQHLDPINELISILERGEGAERFVERARELYGQNLVPHIVYSTLPTLRGKTVSDRLVSGEITAEDALNILRRVREEVRKFVVIAGIKTSDGETGSTGPQVAESLSMELGIPVPSVTYVRDLDADVEAGQVYVERRIGDLIQKLQVPLPCVLTISTEYRPRVPSLKMKKRAILYSYARKVYESVVWNADAIGADPQKIGLAGSPTIVGPGIDIGTPPVQKIVGTTRVLASRVEPFELNGKTYGPYERFTRLEDLPEEAAKHLEARGLVKIFSLEDLVEELFGGWIKVAGEQRV
jgi:electron transfer flavoprotein beta subunit